MSTSRRALARPLTLALIAAFAIAMLPGGTARPVLAVSPDVVISQVYGGGGLTGATYTHDFVELFNRGSSSVSIAGWSVQYASATGTGNFGGTDAQITVLPSLTLQAGQYALVQGATNGAIGSALPTPDVTDAGPINLGGTAGKVALVTSSTTLGCNGSSTPCSSTQLALVRDLVGYGTANFFEGSAAAAAPSATTSVLRGAAGCTDTDQNGSDFSTGTPAPRNTASPLSPCPVGDAAPTVASSTPADGATNVAANASLSVTFSEQVVVASGAITLTCGGVAKSITVSGDPGTTFDLTYLPPLPDGATCEIAISAAGITDTDTDDPPDAMAANASIDFTVVAADPCAGTFTPIFTIQGGGTASPLVGQTVTTEGVVTAVFPNLRGFTLLDTTGDANATTSDGIFVFRGPAFPTNTPAVGDPLRITGRVTEFQNQTEMDNLTQLIDCGSETAPDPVTIALPETTNGDLERYEGMVVRIDQTMTAQQNFFQGRFGQVTLASGTTRLATPTNEFPAGSAEAIALADENQRRLIVLDDANSNQNPNPIPYIGDDDTLRAGDTTDEIVGLLDEGAINSNTAIRDYRIQPTAPVAFTRVNERPEEPADVGGWLQVASFNVLNYFNGDGVGGGFPTERGANTMLEFQRQRTKIIEAIVALDADIVGLMEIENDGSGATSAIADLVAGLNAATAPGTYDWIDDPASGVAKPDEPIKTAIIYRPDAVTPVGASRSDTDPSFERYPVAQTFRLDANGEVVTVLVNHFKSKGCTDAVGGDLDQGDGQGCFNPTRVAEAHALLAFIDELIDDTGDEDVMVIGDLNAYAQEDPIQVLLAGGLTDQLAADDPDAYTYVFDGQAGVLDHGLVTASLLSEVTGSTIWHINADEPSVIDYNTEFKPQDLYAPDAFRASDHDPVLIGLDLGRCAFEDSGTTRTLLGDCSTDETIEVPDGWTLDGDGYTISAFDPVGDHFRGGVVANAGAVAHVRDVTVTTFGLADICDAGDDRLRGILLDGAAGSITGTRVVDVDQGSSGCQEGNGIEVRNAPFASGGTDLVVSIVDNEVTRYQKAGIVVNGSVYGTVRDNVVTGDGPTGVIAQNGIQVGFGGSAFLRGNTVSGNWYTGPDIACGLLFFEADGVKQQANVLFANERDVCNFGRGGGSAKPTD